MKLVKQKRKITEKDTNYQTAAISHAEEEMEKER